MTRIIYRQIKTKPRTHERHVACQTPLDVVLCERCGSGVHDRTRGDDRELCVIHRREADQAEYARGLASKRDGAEEDND